MMDLSKLPRLSKTDASDTPGNLPPADPSIVSPATPMAAPRVAADGDWCIRCGAPLLPGAKFCNSCGNAVSRAPGGGMAIEAWICIGLGLFLMFMFPMGARYWSAKMTGQTFAPYVDPEDETKHIDFTRWINQTTGAVTEVKYRDTNEFWSDTGVTGFALALILDGIVIAFFRKRPLVIATFIFTIAMTLFNVGYVVKSFSQNLGFAPVSFIAIIVGGMMLFYQWSVIQSLRLSRIAQQRVA